MNRYNASMKSIETIISELIDSAHVLENVVSVSLREASGRVLAVDVLAQMDVPPFDNSAMDGYAVAAPEGFDETTAFRVVQRITAGETGVPLTQGEAARIFTGAAIPDGTTQVVMQELCVVSDDVLHVRAVCASGEFIRRRAEDVAAGTTLLKAGLRLTAAHVALLASMGVEQVLVRPLLKVALLTTGSELVDVGRSLAEGQIYNSNRYALAALLGQWGCEVVLDEQVADDLSLTIDLLRRAAVAADLIVTCGGVSVGEEDYVKQAIMSLGELHSWQVAMKPGKPLAFGQVLTTPLIGLPGNPVSSFVTACLCVRPYVRARLGMTQLLPRWFDVVADFEWGKPDVKRVEFLRATYTDSGVQLAGAQGSGVMTSLANADVLVRVEASQMIRVGDVVRAVSLAELMSL